MPTPPRRSNNSAHDNSTNTQVSLPILKSSRQTKPPNYFQDYHSNIISNTIPISEAVDLNASSQCKYPLSSFLSYDALSHAHKHFTLNLYAITGA